MTKILGISDEVNYFWSGLSFTENPFFILDILIVALIVYYIYVFLKETRAMRIVYGIVIIIVLFFASQALNLIALNYLLKGLTTMFVVAIPIVFQPELRSLLERLGRADIVSDFKKMRSPEIENITSEIVDAVKILSKQKTGALIVITQKTGIKNIIDTGSIIKANINKELILTIFHHKTPLHDGAMIIKGNKIIAAGCTLPLSEDSYESHIGTRHRAALGLSEQSDAIIIVVSEETGDVSIASKGIMTYKIDTNKLNTKLFDMIKKGKSVKRK